ncbi:Chaperonin 60 subunit beta 4, chloroplastic [Sesamum angolense]|nr:Chaperonin 60 subunit beta 4, chloroplastic [Sesamum angolense]
MGWWCVEIVKKREEKDPGGGGQPVVVAGVNKVAEVIGVTLGPKGRNVVLQNKYGPPKIVNDGETVLKEIELDDPLENVGVKLVRQAGARTNDLAGDGCTTSIVLAQGLIAEGVKVIAAGLNPVQVSRGIDKTASSYFGTQIDVQRVGRWGVVTIEKGNYAENNLEIVEGMQFDRGYLSPYFVTDRQKMTVEFHDCKLLLVDKKITDPRELFKILDNAVKEKYPVVIVAEGIEQEALAPVIRNKLRGVLKAAAIKAPAFGFHTDSDRWKHSRGCQNRVSQMQRLVEVGAQTVVELKDKQLRAEDALNATKAAIEEGVVVGGGCCLLRLSTKIDSVREDSVIRRHKFWLQSARDRYEDLMAAGILDPSKVVRCCLEHAASVAKTFLTADAVVIEIKEPVSKVLRKPIPTSEKGKKKKEEMAMLMMGLSVQCVLDFMVAGISLMIGLGLFAFIASILCSAAFFQNAKEIS